MAVRARPRDPGDMNETTVEQPAAKRLERSRSDRMLAGVSGGLARYFDIHPAFYRVGFVVLTLIGGAGVLIYIAAALVIPDEGEEDSIAAKALRERRDRPWPLVGLALIAIAALVLLSRVSVWPRGDASWILLLVGGIIVLQLSHRPRPVAAAEPAEGTEQTETAARAARPSPWRWPKRIAIGLATAFGIALAFVLVAAAIFAAVFHVHVGNGIGDRTYDVTALSDLRSEYKLGIGDLRVDMRDVQLPLGVTPSACGSTWAGWCSSCRTTPRCASTARRTSAASICSGDQSTAARSIGASTVGQARARARCPCRRRESPRRARRTMRSHGAASLRPPG
jgi:phage shock protein PspC (stress-responsive transcriptional regulator)